MKELQDAVDTIADIVGGIVMINYTSIETQIQRIQGKVEETYDIAEAKGAEITSN